MCYSLVLKPLFPVYIMLSLLAVSEIFKRKAFQAPLVLGPGSVERGPGPEDGPEDGLQLASGLDWYSNGEVTCQP